MKNKNQRELEKYWAKEATKKAKLAKKATPPSETTQPTAAPVEKEAKKR